MNVETLAPESPAGGAPPAYRSPLLDAPGAVSAVGVDAGVPDHFGDPFGEQRAAYRDAAVIDRSHRDIITITGSDRLGWLHSICSQHVSDLADGQSADSLVLSPTGHIEQQWTVTELDSVLWIDSEPGTADEVHGYLQKMRFLKRVEPAVVTPHWAVLSVLGPRAAAVVVAAGLPQPSAEPHRSVRIPTGGLVRTLPPGDLPALDVLVPRAELAAWAARLADAGARRAGMWTWEAVRVASRRPRLRFETDHRTIAHEIGLIGPAVHLNKGCYRGQETVARVQNLGKPPRRMVLLHLSGEDDVMPAAGTPVSSGGRAVGFLGTAVQHAELGPIALAVIKRTVADDADLTVAGHPVKIDASS